MMMDKAGQTIASEGLRAVVALAVVASTTVLGVYDVIDAAACTGILGAVVGAAAGRFGSRRLTKQEDRNGEAEA